MSSTAREHQGRVAVAFGDLSDEDQVACSTSATSSPRRFAAAGPDGPPRSSRHCGGDPDAVLIRSNRRVRPARPQPS
jgi:hypothetical protein